MPKKAADPILAVLKYFEQAPLDAARQGLALAKEVLRRRTLLDPIGSVPTPDTTLRRKKRGAPPAPPGPLSTVG